MKSLKEYSREQLFVDESLIDIFKGFWSWLTGKNNKDEYDPLSYHYDEKEKVRYINKFTSDNVISKEVENTKILNKIISNSMNEDNPKCGFFELKEYFKTHPDTCTITDNIKWLSFIFKTDDLTDTCALIGYRNDDSDFSGKNVIFVSEFLPIYKYVINYGDVLNALDKIGDIIIKDKFLISQFKKEDLDIKPAAGKKNAYELC